MALEILEYLARQKEPVGVAAIASALGITKSRVYRHLRTLLERWETLFDDAQSAP